MLNLRAVSYVNACFQDSPVGCHFLTTKNFIEQNTLPAGIMLAEIHVMSSISFMKQIPISQFEIHHF